MKKLILIITMIIGMSVSVYAMWPFDGLIKAQLANELNAIKAQIASMINTFNTKITGIEGDITGIKEVNLKLSAKLDVQANTVAGMNNQISTIKNDITAGRDVTQGSHNTNDTVLMERIITIQKESLTEQIAIWKALFRWLLVLVVTPLLSLNAWTMKSMFKEMSNARYWQTETVSRAEPEELDKIMEKKKEIDSRKGIINTVKDTAAAVGLLKRTR